MGFMPVNDEKELRAVSRILTWAEENFTGYTETLQQPSVIVGHYKSASGWVVDRISLLILDLELDETATHETAELIRTKVSIEYIECGSAQDEIWVTVQDLRVPQSGTQTASA